jgi:tetratricopeptide (TPR) repeat protein
LRILQLRHLKDNDSIQYSQKLKVTAAFAPDRVRLYQLMHNVAEETVSKNGYEPLSPSTSDSNTVIYEETISDPSSEAAYYAQRETELTPQEIVENRLKELNLWKEKSTEETDIVAQLNLEPEPEVSNITEAILAPEDPDPLEDLIKEAIVETQTKESDYFTEIGLSEDEEETAEVELEIQKQDLILQHQEEDEVATEIVIEEFLSPQPTAEAIAEVEVEEKHIAPTAKITAEDHSSEAHSFAEWLRINHPHDEEETTSTASPVVEIVEIIEPNEETPIIAKTPIIPEAEINDIPFEQPTAYVIEANEQAHEEVEKTSNINIPANADKAAEPTSTDLSATVRRPATADKPTAKVLYMKGGAVEATPAPRPAPAERPQPRELYRSSPTPQPAYTPPPQPATPVAPSVEAPITPAASNENNGPSLRTNRELGLKEVIKPSKKGKKSRPNTENSQNQADKKVPGKNEQIKIIEQFIQQEPRITPMKAYNNPVNMARKSVQESDELVTETLAAIYAQQGNFEKAISFYEKLSLKIPEKSAYFAALIKDLKNKLNS